MVFSYAKAYHLLTAVEALKAQAPAAALLQRPFGCQRCTPPAATYTGHASGTRPPSARAAGVVSGARPGHPAPLGRPPRWAPPASLRRSWA
eukprot:5432435-Lingulodinium_polyedra.AAC.1